MSKKNHPPLVAMIANFPKGTGYAWWLMERFWNEISDAASTCGWQSIVIYPESTTKNHTELNSTNDSQLESFLSNGSLRDVFTIYHLVRNLNIRSIYLCDYPFRSWKYLFLRFSGVKSIVVHDHTPGDRPAITGIKGLVKLLLNSLPWITASQHIAISPLMRQRHLLNARIPDYRIATVTNGIVVRDLAHNARELVLEKFGLEQDNYITCVVGRLNPYKRFDFAVKCIGKLADENPESNPVLIILGDGPDRSRLENLASKQNPNCKVIFAGQVDDVWSILCGVDTVIHPSAGEGLSLAILEAMAAARPIVVPSLPSVSQTIENRVNGLIYSDGSLEEGKQLLRELSSNHELRNTLGVNARHTVIEKYQLDRALVDFNSDVVPILLKN